MAAALQVVEDVVTEELVNDEVVISPADEMDELEAMFSELEGELSSPQVEPTEEEMAAAGQAVVVEELRAAAEEEMAELSNALPDDSALATGALSEPVKRKGPVTKRISTAGGPKSEAISKALGSKLTDYLLLEVDDLALDGTDQADKVVAKLKEIDGLPVKIGEKVVNLYAHLVNGATLSTYTRMAIEMLVRDGQLSSKGLRDAYIARPYSIGTANSQCTQLMKLLPTLGLATKTGSLLTANPNSTLLPMFTES